MSAVKAQPDAFRYDPNLSGAYAPIHAAVVRLVMRVKLQGTELNTTSFIFGG
jgi:hypothetical protein